MNQYTIYCTDEQIKKALDLGAALDEIAYSKQNEEYIQTDNYRLYQIPTAEQMINWLEEQKCINYITISYANENWYYDINTTDDCFWLTDLYFDSRKDATLAAIDAVLDYLKEHKEI